MSGADRKGKTDLAIIGAGPAGLAAAVEARAAGLHVTVLDEQPAPGGQIYRDVERISGEGASRLRALGPDYARGADLVAAFRRSGAVHLPAALVWQIEPGRIWYIQEGRVRTLLPRRILIATGALERPVPVPGWTLPGAMTAGAAQILLKTAGLVPQSDAVLVGHGPLLYLLAQQILAAGGRLQGLVETLPPGRYRRAAAHLPAALGSGYLAKGAKLILALRRGGVPIYRRAEDVRIEGDGAVSGVSFRSGGTTVRLSTTSVFLHEGVIPNTQLTLASGCAHRWDDDQQCFRPESDAWGNTSVPDIMVAGDGAGIGGAAAAAEAGRLAGLEAAHALGRIDRATRDSRAAGPRRALRKLVAGRRFLEVLYAPTNVVPTDPATIVCRCEEVTAGEVRAAVGIGGTGPNQIKSYLRCGMGPCQGRMCGATVTALIADERGVSPEEVGYFRIRPPIKPIPLLAMAEADLSEPEAPAA